MHVRTTEYLLVPLQSSALYWLHCILNICLSLVDTLRTLQPRALNHTDPSVSVSRLNIESTKTRTWCTIFKRIVLNLNRENKCGVLVFTDPIFKCIIRFEYRIHENKNDDPVSQI